MDTSVSEINYHKVLLAPSEPDMLDKNELAFKCHCDDGSKFFAIYFVNDEIDRLFKNNKKEFVEKAYEILESCIEPDAVRRY